MENRTREEAVESRDDARAPIRSNKADVRLEDVDHVDVESMFAHAAQSGDTQWWILAEEAAYYRPDILIQLAYAFVLFFFP